MILLIHNNTKSEPWVCGRAGSVMDSSNPSINHVRNGWQSSRHQRIDKVVGVTRAPYTHVGRYGYTGRRLNPATCTNRATTALSAPLRAHITLLWQRLNVWGRRLIPGHAFGRGIGCSGKHYQDYVIVMLYSLLALTIGYTEYIVL